MSEWIRGYNEAVRSLPLSVLPVFFGSLCNDVCNIIRQYEDRNVFDVLHERLIGIERYQSEVHLHGYEYFTRMTHEFVWWCDIPFLRSLLFTFFHSERQIALKFDAPIPTREEAETWRPLLSIFWTSVLQMDLPILHLDSYDLLVFLKSDNNETITADLRQFLTVRHFRFRIDDYSLSPP